MQKHYTKLNAKWLWILLTKKNIFKDAVCVEIKTSRKKIVPTLPSFRTLSLFPTSPLKKKEKCHLCTPFSWINTFCILNLKYCKSSYLKLNLGHSYTNFVCLWTYYSRRERKGNIIFFYQNRNILLSLKLLSNSRKSFLGQPND